jgi:ATP/maltotriose-dependent transcriptional regulator MalT
MTRNDISNLEKNLMTTLLATKLYQPAPPPKRIQRPSLIQRLNEGLAAGSGITLVSAPAGFGKSTCVSAWVLGVQTSEVHALITYRKSDIV